MAAQIEKLSISHKLNSTAFLCRDGEQRLGHNLAFQYLEEADNNNQLVGSYGEGEHAVLIFADGSVAAGIRILSPSTYFANTSLKRSITNNLHSFLATCDPSLHLQAFTTVGDQDDDLLDEFLAQNDLPGQHPIVQKIRSDQYSDFSERIQQGKIRVYKSYLFINKAYPLKNANKARKSANGSGAKGSNILSVLTGSLQSVFSSFTESARLTQIPEHEIEKKTLLELINQLLEQRKIMHQQIAQTPGLTVLPVTTEEVFRLYKRAFSPSDWNSTKTVKKQQHLPQRPLRSGLANYYATETFTDQGWTFKGERYWHGILSLAKAPAQLMLGTMGETLTYQGTSEIHNLDITLILKPTDGEREKAKIIHQHNVMQTQYTNNPSRYPHYKTMLDSMRLQIQRLQEEAGVYGFHATYLLHYWHEDQQTLQKWTQILRQNYAAQPVNAQFGEEQYHALPYFLTKGQLGYTRDTDKNREFPILAKEAAMLLPMLSTETSLIQSSPIDRRITLLTEDVFGSLLPYDSHAIGKVTSYSGVIVGSPGSGKTTLVCRLATLLASPKDRIIILDGGEAECAYQRLTQILSSEADFIELKPSSKYTINVLETELYANGMIRPPTPEDFNRMVYAVEPMLREVNTIPLSNTDIGIIEEGIRSAFNRNLTPKPIYLRDLAQALKEFTGDDLNRRTRAMQLGNILRESWTENKRYGHIFDTDSSPLNQTITTFTTKGLKNDPLLKYVMTKAVHAKVDQLAQANLHLPEEKRYRIHFLVDEALKELLDPVSCRSITEKYRLGRALNLSTYLMTQHIKDLRNLVTLAENQTGTKAGQDSNEILSNCNFVWLGAMEKQDAEIAQKLLSLSNTQTETVASLSGVPGSYREFALRARLIDGTSFHKILIRLTDIEYPLYASNAQSAARLATLKEELETEFHWNSAYRKKARDTILEELNQKRIGAPPALALLTEQQLFLLLICQRYVEKFVWPEKNRVVKAT